MHAVLQQGARGEEREERKAKREKELEERRTSSTALKWLESKTSVRQGWTELGAREGEAGCGGRGLCGASLPAAPAGLVLGFQVSGGKEIIHSSL